MTSQPKPTILDAALQYVDKGFSIIPCEGKRAAVPWSPYQKRTTRFADVHRWFSAGLLKNVAVICGDVSRNLVVVDLDGDDAVLALGAQFPDLFNTYTVRSGSGHGAHLYFRVEVLPRSTRGSFSFGNIELRANGCYVVAPPSIHPDSHLPYVVSNRQPIRRLSTLNDLAQWIEQLNRERHGPVTHTPAPALTESRATAWALAALRAESIAVEHAPAGARNATLNRAAFKLGQIVAGGQLSRAKVEQELIAAAAALIRDDGEKQVENTIRSGLEAGLKQPRGK
jgi:hypothetical protein